MTSHEEKVRGYLRSHVQLHGKLPTQAKIRNAKLGNTSKVMEAWHSVRGEPEFSLQTSERAELVFNGNEATLKAPLPKGGFSEKWMLERFEIDTKIWRVREFQIKTWRGLLGEGKTVVQDWAFIKLERIISTEHHAQLEELKNSYLNLAKKHSPKYPKLPKKQRGEFLLEPCFSDVHFGMHSWGLETGQDYDLKIASQNYKAAGEDLYDKLKHYKADRILMPIGNDLLHVDNPHGTTTKGTRQDTDSRITKAYNTALESVIWSIDLFSSLANVDVFIVPGNHATLLEQLVGEHLRAWYRHANNVTVDTSPSPRKYYTWRGKVLLGLTHSDKEKKAKLPNIMSHEAKPDLSKIVCREFHTGHTHTRTLEEMEGVVIRTIPALVPSDSWHHQSGYVGNLKACEGLVFSEKGFESSHIGRVN